jgi:hypothetical protein
MLMRILLSAAVLCAPAVCFADKCTGGGESVTQGIFAPGLPGNYTSCMSLRPHCTWDPQEQTCKAFWHCNDYRDSQTCGAHGCRWDGRAEECTPSE